MSERIKLNTKWDKPILDNEDKHTIFRQAYLVSNQLIIWNQPKRLKLLPKELQEQTKKKLFSDISIDNLIVKYLDNGAFIKGEYEKLTDEQAREIAVATSITHFFIRSLEKETRNEGEIEKILKDNENKDMKDLVEFPQEIREWLKNNMKGNEK